MEKTTKHYYSTCVAVADSISLQRCWMLNVALSIEGWLLARAPFYRLSLHYIKRGFYLPAKPKGDRHFLSTQYGEERYWPSSCWICLRKVNPLTCRVVFRYFLPPPPLSASQFRDRISRPHTASALHHVWIQRILDTVRWGGGLGSPLAVIFGNTEIWFFDDFSIVVWFLARFLVINFSSWTGGFLM